MEVRLAYRKLRAPAADGHLLQEPLLSDFARTLKHNRELLAGHCFEFSGQSICEIQKAARSELVVLAAEHSGVSADSFAGKSCLILSGHQPTLFHPGVWLKNFALNALANKHEAVAVNLVVDNDLSGLPAINVPTGSIADPKLKLVKFDSQSLLGPFETETISDLSLFESFADRVAETVSPFVQRPLVKQLWPHVLESIGTSNNPAMAIASGRHRLEQQFGLNNLEIPLSRVCETQSFALFVAEIMNRGDQLHSIYNESLVEYRLLNRIRSSAHPVPSLRQVDDWIELPFWIWSNTKPTRSPLFISTAGDAVHLSDGADMRHKLNRDNLDAELQQLTEQGIRLRPRALMTTMYSRMVLSDAFLHGIGGAKYDQLTDQIMSKMFGVDPPQFNTVTGTFWLPLQIDRGSKGDLIEARSQMRAMRFHPERFVEDSTLAQRKRDILASRPADGSRKPWHDRLDEINLQMFDSLQIEREQWKAQLQDAKASFNSSKLLSSREFSFCLFEKELVERLRVAVL